MHGDLGGQHGSLCGHPRSSKQPQNAKFMMKIDCSLVPKNQSPFWPLLAFLASNGLK